MVIGAEFVIYNDRHAVEEDLFLRIVIDESFVAGDGDRKCVRLLFARLA